MFKYNYNNNYIVSIINYKFKTKIFEHLTNIGLF